MIYILYNPLSRGKTGKKIAEDLASTYDNKEVILKNVLDNIDYNDFFNNLKKEDEIIICGGDGTLNYFVNDTKDINIENKVYFYCAGSGNDFYKDIKKNDDKKILINEYIKDLPICKVNGKERLFLNGVSMGLDGYSCAVANEQRKKSNRKINYIKIAFLGLLFYYKPCDVKITVDGVSKTYKKAWLVPTMLGKYYGGGAMITPFQDRRNKEKMVTSAIVHNASKLKLIFAYPSIFKGKHVKYKSLFEMRRGHHIIVEFNKPIDMQIDGEVIGKVKKYEVIANRN